MAIDNAEKRRSISGIGMQFVAAGVTPNSGKDQEWRQQAGWSYSGILADSPAAPGNWGGFDYYYKTLLASGNM